MTTLALLAGPALGSTYSVTSTGDGTDASPGDDICATAGAVCTLRAAIEEANAHSGADNVHFSIGSGSVTISPASSLPDITDETDIDGTTQPGWTLPPIVELDGASASSDSGLRFRPDPSVSSPSGSSVRGLVVNGFTGGAGVETYCSNNVAIQGNRIGTNLAGSAADANGTGVLIRGGTQLTSGCGFGTASGNTIGGMPTADRNLISGNTGRAIWLRTESANGEAALLNNTIRDNAIGIAANGFSALGNGDDGVYIQGGGGSNTIQGNVIANNGGDGIVLERGANSISANFPLANQLVENSIHSNAGMGIDLVSFSGDSGMSPNDHLDADTGINGRQNFPFIDSAIPVTGGTAVAGKLYSEPNTGYRLEFFASFGCNASGRTFLGSFLVTTNASGEAAYSQTVGATIDVAVTATATPTGGPTQNSTSEFSPCRMTSASAPPQRTLTVTPAGAGSGAVTGPGINCPGDCTESFGSDTPVQLTANAAGGHAFDGWNGDCTGTGACDLTMSSNRSVTATFSIPPETLTVTPSGAGSGTITSSPPGITCPSDCSESFANGTVVTLNQNAGAGSIFAGWSGDCTGTAACQVTMTAPRGVGASFAVERTLVVARQGGGTGVVTGPGINCGSGPGETDCSQGYADGAAVSLNASASGGSSFAGWSGDCSGSGACGLTMSANRAATASFNPPTVFPPQDTTPPDTTISSSPSKAVKKKATFSFSASEIATFECRVDSTPFAACSSPFTTAKLKPGKHTFQVRAKDSAGNVDASPASKAFKVKKKKKR